VEGREEKGLWHCFGVLGLLVRRDYDYDSTTRNRELLLMFIHV